MSQLIDTLLADLRTLIRDLGKDGGLISPSVYDTAQVLRFCPPKEGVEPALEWILSQQQPDGGWGNPAVPLSRHMPTLASVLALHTYSKINPQKIEGYAQAGMEFLHKHANEWQNAHIDDYPIAVEVVLPKLLEDAEALGFTLPREPYAQLMKLGNKKRQQIAKMNPTAGTAPTYSWEGWGTNPRTDVVDAIGSVGTSPAATAAWIYAANGYSDLANACQLARDYLKNAMTATRVGIPGVVPTVFPIDHFEQSYGLYALLISGLLDHPKLQDISQAIAKQLAMAWRPTGMGHCLHFTPDCDDTAITLIALQAMGYNYDITILDTFKHHDHFMTYFHEFNPSIFTNARAVHALAHFGKGADQPRKFLLKHQLFDGRWPADKWHSSWLYTTLEVVLALIHFEYTNALQSACNAVLCHQHEDGGWGIGGKSTISETAYSVLMLYILHSQTIFNEQVELALCRGNKWLLNHYDPLVLNENKLWIAKELYSPHRVNRAFELSAILTLTIKEVLS